jgi:hypothetical protein
MQNICEMIRKYELSIIGFGIAFVVVTTNGLATTVVHVVCAG